MTNTNEFNQEECYNWQVIIDYRAYPTQIMESGQWLGSETSLWDMLNERWGDNPYTSYRITRAVWDTKHERLLISTAAPNQLVDIKTFSKRHSCILEDKITWSWAVEDIYRGYQPIAKGVWVGSFGELYAYICTTYPEGLHTHYRIEELQNEVLIYE